MPGPAPKHPSQRMRQNRTATAATLEAAPASKVPLPERRSAMLCTECSLGSWDHNRKGFEREEVFLHEFVGKVVPYSVMTLRWWEAIWDSPMSAEWVDADVPGLLALSALVDRFWGANDSGIAAEIRMQNREYGLSPLSRRMLQWEIKKVEGHKPPVQTAGPRRAGKAVLTALTGGKATTRRARA